MTQTRDLIKKMADFFAGEEFYEKGEDARLELSTDDVRCMNEVIKACSNAISRQAVMEHYSTGEIAHCHHISRNNLLDFVEQLPSVTPQPRIGRWYSTTIQGEIDDLIVRAFSCSECDAISVFRMTSDGEIVNGDFCPNCRAKMEMEE